MSMRDEAGYHYSTVQFTQKNLMYMYIPKNIFHCSYVVNDGTEQIFPPPTYAHAKYLHFSKYKSDANNKL